MSNEKDKQTQQLIKQIHLANQAVQEWSQCFGDLLKDLLKKQQFIDIGEISFDRFQQQTCVQIPEDRPSFFSQIPLTTVDEQLQQKILSLQLNFISQRRREQMFKKHKRQQEQKYTFHKKEIEKQYMSKMDNYRNIKGQFTLKRGDQIHTCSITGDDLQKLRPETDLNDTIIANYLKYLQTQVFSEEVEKSTFIYSTFFIEKLIGELLRQENLINLISEKNIELFGQKMRARVIQNYKNIKRWTRKFDIFEKKFLVIPINAFKHWYCIIVVNPGCIIEPKEGKQAYIANCDSMFQKRGIIIDAVRMYLQVELQDKKGKKLQINEGNCPSYHLLLPRQTNTHDCGLYMLNYIEHLLTNPQHLQNINSISNRQKLNLFPRSLIFTMRERLKDLFISLIQTSDQAAKKQIFKKYKQQTQSIIGHADDIDYDKINQKQFKKYDNMNGHMIDMMGWGGRDIDQQEREYACKVRFYIDPDINYFERDRLMF